MSEMTMKWNDGLMAFTNLQREVNRLRECRMESNLSIEEIDAFSLVLFEIAWAIANAQPRPMGKGESISLECIRKFKDAARMAERERNDTPGIRLSLPPLVSEAGRGQVIDMGERPS